MKAIGRLKSDSLQQPVRLNWDDVKNTTGMYKIHGSNVKPILIVFYKFGHACRLYLSVCGEIGPINEDPDSDWCITHYEKVNEELTITITP